MTHQSLAIWIACAVVMVCFSLAMALRSIAEAIRELAEAVRLSNSGTPLLRSMQEFDKIKAGPEHWRGREGRL